jgi:hypothetical protein
MSFFTALRRQPRCDDITPPEPTFIGEGDYQLLDDSIHFPDTVRCLTTLADAMRAAEHPNPDHWYPIFGDIAVEYVHRRGPERWTIKGPNVITLLDEMQKEKRRAEEQQRRENRARWEAAAAKRKAEEAAKPKLVISYLSVAGQALGDSQLSVEVVTRPGFCDRTDHTETVATCKACGESHTVEWNGSGWDHRRWLEDRYDTDGKLSTPRAQKWAQEHAETCRAMPPKPGESS